MIAVNSFGQLLEHPYIEVQRLAQGKVVETVAGSPRMSLRYGDYRFRVEQSGHAPGSRVVRIGSPVATAILCATVAPIENVGGNSVLKGRVEPLDLASSCPMVRLVPVYCDEAPLEAEVSSTGRFVFENVKPGKYLAILLAPERICNVSTHDVLMRALQEIIVRANNVDRAR